MFRSITTIALILLLGLSVSAQTEKGRQFYIDQIDAVYGVDYFNDRPEARERYVELLRDRISYGEKAGLDSSHYELLSAAGLNKNVTPGQAAFKKFNPDTFNPLMYNLVFFDWDRSRVYRIDGTDFYIIIQPQTPAK